MRRVIATLALVAGLAASAAAQSPLPSLGYEIRSFAGAYLPTGIQSDEFKVGEMLGVQLARELSDNVHVLGSFGWTHGHNKYPNRFDDRTFIYQYDVGFELNTITPLEKGWFLRPFAGAGVGARHYDFMASGLASSTCAAGYGGAGTEFQRGIGAVRLEVRDYLNCLTSPITGLRRMRNDVGISLGAAYHIR